MRWFNNLIAFMGVKMPHIRLARQRSRLIRSKSTTDELFAEHPPLFAAIPFAGTAKEGVLL